MNSSYGKQEKSKLRFNDEPACREKLKLFEFDELILTAGILSEKLPKSMPKDNKALIEIIISELATFKFRSGIKPLDDVIFKIRNSISTTDESQWIKDPMPKRLEYFLRNKVNLDWVEIVGISKKKHFLLMYDLNKIRGYNNGTQDNLESLHKLRRDWAGIENINELEGQTKEDTKEFLEYFSKEYKKLLQENVGIFALRKLESIHLETTEDALIWLDLFSDNPLERSAITDKILKKWKQKQYRKTSGKTQKNFNLSEATISTLKKLANEYDLNETEVITILIKEELKNDLYIKEVLARANALQRAIEGE